MTRRGFMLLIALGLLSVLSMVVLLLTLRISTDVRQTLQATAEVQERLLFLSAAVEARQQLASGATREGAMLVPELLAGSWVVRLERWEVKDGAASVRAVVTTATRQTEQVAEFERDGASWRLVLLQKVQPDEPRP